MSTSSLPPANVHEFPTSTKDNPNPIVREINTLNDIANRKELTWMGYCCYFLLALMSTAALICSLWAYSYCDFASRDITLQDDFSVRQACRQTDFVGGMRYTCEAFLRDHSVGFRGWYARVEIFDGGISGNEDYCFDYTQPTAWGWVTPDLDSTFYAARGCLIAGIAFGMVAWTVTMIAVCCPLYTWCMRLLLSMTFMIAGATQACSLLLLNSSVCKRGFFAAYFDDPNAERFQPEGRDIIDDVSCGLSVGSKLAISAACMSFACSFVVCCSNAPANGFKQSYKKEAQKALARSQMQAAPEQAPMVSRSDDSLENTIETGDLKV